MLSCCVIMMLSWCYHVAFVTLRLFSRNQEFSVLRNWVCNTSLYEINCSFGSQESPCSSLGCSTTVLPLYACREDLTAHLVGLCVSGKRGWRSQSSEMTEITEKELLLNRAGHFDLSEDSVTAMTICPKHRRDLTSDWRGRKSTTCCYPLHKGQRKTAQEPTPCL